MIGIIDYGAGNLFSVKNALDYLGAESRITGDPQEIKKADALILPGVGAFPDAMKMLENRNLVSLIREAVSYTHLSVYFIAAKISKTRYTVVGALLATLGGIWASVVLAGMM